MFGFVIYYIYCAVNIKSCNILLEDKVLFLHCNLAFSSRVEHGAVNIFTLCIQYCPFDKVKAHAVPIPVNWRTPEVMISYYLAQTMQQ